jgi:hypothetical protein
MKEEKLSETKKGILIFIGAIVFSLIIGGACGGLAAYRIYGGRSPGDVDRLAAEYNQLAREYAERLSVIREQQKLITIGIDNCLGYVEEAGDIITRASSNTAKAVGNLTEAIRYIRQGIEEREALKNQLDNINSGLHGLRNANWNDDL